MRTTNLSACLLCLLLISSSFAQAPEPRPDWSAWQFVLGDGGGGPGQGSGSFSLFPDLQNSVLVRRNHADYPPQDGRKSFAHDDLMIVFRAPDTQTRADYCDSEGHVIRYTVTMAPDTHSVTFLSDSLMAGPRFRLIYTKEQDGQLGISFDMAAPGTGSSFTPYIKAFAHRK